ncbi:MAG: hypothetical protein ACM3UZ_07620 [Acidobacteriota bacterium]
MTLHAAVDVEAILANESVTDYWVGEQLEAELIHGIIKGLVNSCSK